MIEIRIPLPYRVSWSYSTFSNFFYIFVLNFFILYTFINGTMINLQLRQDLPNFMYNLFVL